MEAKKAVIRLIRSWSGPNPQQNRLDVSKAQPLPAITTSNTIYLVLSESKYLLICFN